MLFDNNDSERICRGKRDLGHDVEHGTVMIRNFNRRVHFTVLANPLKMAAPGHSWSDLTNPC
jgi:hypothetical protein